jgi:hypothetical protein
VVPDGACQEQARKSTVETLEHCHVHFIALHLHIKTGQRYLKPG